MKLKDAIEILRPINCLMGALTVIIGLLNTRTSVSLPLLLSNFILGTLTYIFLAGSGMVINDFYDYEIDKINRPQRPIPRGSVSLSQAKMLFFTYLSIGLLLSVLNILIFNLNYIIIVIAAFFGFMGWIYAKWGKKSGFLGNIIVSISFSIGMIYGALLNSSSIPIYVYYFFLTAFFLLLSREIIKGCEDIEGDKKEGVKTLAIRIGAKKSITFAMISSLLAVIFFTLPLFTNIINPFLFLITMSSGLIIVAFSIFLMIKINMERNDFKRVSLFLKLGALLGLLSFVFASL
ncbi:MAG: geranylgeranylglycerol-phosphate geranylgeranyltransferase [Candidatus Lokiarchaeota archaeon]|nr:geranylgeranylglycerol-phosphate geranylgeranyltransferase [Candidatus Lokiarchaeota archaeon]